MNWKILVFVAVLAIMVGAFFMFNGNSSDPEIVLTKSGSVRGVGETSFRNKVKFHAFRGIPYAKPPLGDFRFKAPEPVDPWHPKVLNAVEYGSNCIQPNEFDHDPHAQSEDCLYLNVFVPDDRRSDEKLPVMFFIHGGGYGEGSGNGLIYGPDFLIENRVILVTTNYRVGVLGFLSLGLPEYSGNMGLKDQQLALKWTHENIGRFGGDNAQITIFGQSAGAASTHFHVLSAESQKYFRRAIMMSGSAFSYWALSRMANHTEYAFEMAESWNKPQPNVSELVHLLKTVPPEMFNEFARVIKSVQLTFEIEFAPVVEGSDAVRPFMTQTPEHAYTSTKLNKDVMFGFTSLECLGFFQPGHEDEYDLVLPFRGITIPVGSVKYHELSLEVHDFYFGTIPVNGSKPLPFINLMSDVNFAYPTAKAARTHAQKSIGNTYFYHFDVDSQLNLFKSRAAVKMPGANHCDDVCYLFRCGFGKKDYDEVFGNENAEQSRISRQTLHKLTRLYTNFAKSGSPISDNDIADGDLPPIEGNRTYFVDISNTGLAIGENPHKTTMDFWASIERKALE